MLSLFVAVIPRSLLRGWKRRKTTVHNITPALLCGSLLSFSLVSVLLFSLTVHSLTERKKIVSQTSAKVLSVKIRKPTKIPILTPTYTPTPSPKLGTSPTPTLAPTSKPTPTPVKLESKSITNTSPADFILNKVNEYRAGFGLSKVGGNVDTCSFAQTRAKEIASLDTFNHEGFRNRINSNTLPYPSYHEVTENIAYNTDYKDVVNRWIASSGHAENMRKNTTYVCIGKYGDYYTFEGWTP